MVHLQQLLPGTNSQPGMGQLVAFSEGGEAAQPFQPEGKPVDAYISALIDQIDRPNRTES